MKAFVFAIRIHRPLAYPSSSDHIRLLELSLVLGCGFLCICFHQLLDEGSMMIRSVHLSNASDKLPFAVDTINTETCNRARTYMEVVAAVQRCQMLLIVLMAAMLLPGMKGSPLLVERKIARTIKLQGSIGKGQFGKVWSPFKVFKLEELRVASSLLVKVVVTSGGPYGEPTTGAQNFCSEGGAPKKGLYPFVSDLESGDESLGSLTSSETEDLDSVIEQLERARIRKRKKEKEKDKKVNPSGPPSYEGGAPPPYGGGASGNTFAPEAWRVVRAKMQLACPVFQDPQGERYQEPLDFKVIKSLAESVRAYGITASFTVAQVEALSRHCMTPNNWSGLARACLSPGKYLDWRETSAIFRVGLCAALYNVLLLFVNNEVALLCTKTGYSQVRNPSKYTERKKVESRQMPACNPRNNMQSDG
ncbi:hypothetical protein STEG23_002878 [Scotinomys teguina]